MSRNEIINALSKIYMDLHGEDILIDETSEISANSNNSIQASSLKLVSWILQIEDIYGIEISVEDKLISDIVSKIEAKNYDENK